MHDILTDLIHWREEGRSIALATVIQTWGSSPRGVGSKMAVILDGKMTGSVSGGCVENAVIEAGIQSLKTNQPKLLHFGVADETAWEVGLACGGSLDVFIQPLDMEIFQLLKSNLKDETPIVHVTVIRGKDELLGYESLITENGFLTRSLGNELDISVLEIARDTFVHGKSHRVQIREDVEIFVDVILPPPVLVIVGGVHIAIALASLAKVVGYRTVMIDPRKAWGNEGRFPHVDQLIQAWPEEAFGQVNITGSTAITALTHDPKLDDPALKIALSSSAFYVGALGSKSTNAKRRERLLKDGMTGERLSRLHAPIGIDIGAQSPEEIALAVMSEVVNAYRRQNQQSVKKETNTVPSP